MSHTLTQAKLPVTCTVVKQQIQSNSKDFLKNHRHVQTKRSRFSYGARRPVGHGASPAADPALCGLAGIASCPHFPLKHSPPLALLPLLRASVPGPPTSGPVG